MILGAGNLLFFKAGTVAMAVYLKTRHQLGFTKFVGIMIVDKILMVYGLTLLGLGLGWYLYLTGFVPIGVVLFFLVALLTLTYLLYIQTIRIPNRENQLWQFVSKLLDSWNAYKSDTSTQIRLIAYHFLYIMIWTVRYYVAFHILSFPITLMECILLSFATFFTGIINLVPGALGIRETAVGLSLAYLGSSFDHGVFATALDRLLVTFWSFLLGYLYFNLLHLKGYQKNLEVAPELK